MATGNIEQTPRSYLLDSILLLLVMLVAGGARSWYLYQCSDVGRATPPLQVQATSTLSDRQTPEGLAELVDNLKNGEGFKGHAPLSSKQEPTAHVAPGYVWLHAQIAQWTDEPAPILRWLQVALGVLTVAFYFLFARQAFTSLTVGFLAGLFTALHPFWIIATGELTDGILASFLLAAAIFFGSRSSQTGGPLSGLLFGLALAALCMVRAVMLPFAFIAMIWFLLRCRRVPRGWFCALLALLAFFNGLTPWTLRNYKIFQAPIPLVSSTHYHLWVGNNPQATGGPLDQATLESTLSDNRLAQLRNADQRVRYGKLSREIRNEVTESPAATFNRRLWAGLYFLFGQRWFDDEAFAVHIDAAGEHGTQLPGWLDQSYETLLGATMLFLVIFGLLGFRFSQRWSSTSQLATLAAIWTALPYLLSHGAALSGPRLPLDGVLLCYAALALASFIPIVAPKYDQPQQDAPTES